MQSKVTQAFWKCYAALPKHIKELAVYNYQNYFYNYFSEQGLLVEKSFSGDIILKTRAELLSEGQRIEWMEQGKCYLASLDGSIFEIFFKQ